LKGRLTKSELGANLLGGNFNGIDAGIIPYWHEVEEYLPLVIWNDAMEGLR
jgi:hypothetical protein